MLSVVLFGTLRVSGTNMEPLTINCWPQEGYPEAARCEVLCQTLRSRRSMMSTMKWHLMRTKRRSSDPEISVPTTMRKCPRSRGTPGALSECSSLLALPFRAAKDRGILWTRAEFAEKNHRHTLSFRLGGIEPLGRTESGSDPSGRRGLDETSFSLTKNAGRLLPV